MIKIANAQFWVHDQEDALAFYTRTPGWEGRPGVPHTTRAVDAEGGMDWS